MWEAGLWTSLALLCFVAYFWQLGGVGILDLDEGLYVECAREMALTGDWVTPRVNGNAFFEKPPLTYWAAAASFRLFGRTEVTARLPAAVASALLVGLVFWFGRRHLGRATGWVAASFLALAPLIVGEARQLTTDALLDLWVCLALVLGYEALRATPRAQTLLTMLAWTACAAGVLTKGAPGIFLPGFVMGVYLLVLRRMRVRVPLRLPPWQVTLAGAVLFLVIAAPWHLLAYRANGTPFVQEYIIRQHLGRFQGGDTAHRAPVWFYLPAFLLGAFPWSFFLMAGAKDALGRTKPLAREGLNDDAYRALRTFLWIWVGVVFLVFSAGGSKLVSYILPLYPPAALLAADTFLRGLQKNGRSRVLAACLGLAGLGAMGVVVLLVQRGWVLAAVAAATHKPIHVTQPEEALLAAAIPAAVASACGPVVAAVVLLMGWRRAAPIVAVGGMLAVPVAMIVWFLPVMGKQVVDPVHLATKAAGAEAVRLQHPLAICIGRPRRPSVFFYVPDVLLPHTPRSPSRVFEADGIEQIHTLATLPHGCTVLASIPCALQLEHASGVRVDAEARFGEWRVLEVSEP